MEPENAFEIRLPASTRIVQIRLLRSGRSTRMTLRIKADGSVSAVVPAGMRGNVLEQARLFALKHLDWIDRQLAKFEASPAARTTETLLEYLQKNPDIFAGEHPLRTEISTNAVRPFYVFRPQENVLPIYIREASADADLQQLLTSLAKEILPAQVRELAARYGVSVGSISIRNQQSRWGSCTTHGNLSLNWRLVLLPPAMRDHVLLHELAHRRHMNHSDDFWDLLCAWDPQAVKHDAELRKHWSKVFYFR